MAIIIVKPGVDPNNSYGSVCPTCSSVLTYTWNDIKLVEPISTFHERHLVCPVCSHEFAVNNKPVVTIDLNCNGRILFSTQSINVAIIPEGCRAWGLHANGPYINAVELDKIIPSGTLALIKGTAATIQVIQGADVSGGNDRLSAVKDEVMIDTPYYTISDDWKLIKPEVTHTPMTLINNTNNFKVDITHQDLS